MPDDLGIEGVGAIPDVSVADVLSAPTEVPSIDDAPSVEEAAPVADDRDFADQLLEAEAAAPADERPPGTGGTPVADPLADLRAQFQAQAQELAQLRAHVQRPQLPNPQQFFQPPPQAPPKSFEERVDDRVDAIAKKYGYNPQDPSLRMVAQTQVQNEDFQKQQQFMAQTIQQATQQAQVAQNQRDMDAAFRDDPVLNQIARDNPQIGKELYETGFAIWLATGARSAEGAVKTLRAVIDRTVEHRIQERLSAARDRAKTQPIPRSAGRTVSLATLPPGGMPKFKPRNPARGVEEAAEQAEKYLKAIGVED